MNEPKLPLTANALRVLEHRYLARGADGIILETPAQMFHRVARAVASAERRYGSTDAGVDKLAEQFYQLMASGIFLPNSPTMMNAGRELGMLSACFVLPVDDSIEGIFDSVKATALIQKAGGGTGFAFDRLRPTGDAISTSGGTTSGPISFWRVFSEATSAIQQGAFRRGANMGMMNVAHPDILKFITAKTRLGQFENFNISIKITDEFMDQLASDPDRPHVVVNPRNGRRYFLPRRLRIQDYGVADLLEAGQAAPEDCYSVTDVWELIVSCAHASGEPGICFIDRINADNPTPNLGRIEATNPCGEQPLLDYEACNLGSINLAHFIRDGDLDEEALAHVVPVCVRFLDNVIDVNNYILEPIRAVCLANRKIGLGVMGFADALLRLGVPYDSPEGFAFGRRVAELFTSEAFAASGALAEHRGCFPNYLGSSWHARGRAMRNAAVTTVAPTGTISILANCSGGIEPLFALAYWRNVMGGEHMLEVNSFFRDLLAQRGLDSQRLLEELAHGRRLRDLPEVPEDIRRVFVTAHDVSPQHHVQMQATFQKYVDGAISKTINMPAEATTREVNEVFLLAYNSGLKGITVYRHGCRPEQPMGYEAPSWPDSRCPRCGQDIDAQAACSKCPACGYTICA